MQSIKAEIRPWLSQLDDTHDISTSANSRYGVDYQDVIYEVYYYNVITTNITSNSPLAPLKSLDQPIPMVIINYEENTLEACDGTGLQTVLNSDGEECDCDAPVNTLLGPIPL